MSDDDEGGDVLVFRGVDRPVAVPEEVVLEAQREYRAWHQHREGKTWEQIAATEHYPTADAARQDVRRYLTEGRVLVAEWTRQEMLAVELARLDALQAAYWEPAIGGKIPAAAFVKDIIVTRIKTLRLDEAGAEDETRARTVVVMGTEGDYIQALERLSKD